MLSPGIVLQQRYRIKRLLAQGGMGAVYEAEAIHLRNATVAVKETFYNEDRKNLREQFELEAATLARLRHPALPQVKDHFIEGGGQFLVMDFIDGDDLGNLLNKRKGEPFGFWQVMEWADRLLDALDYIHGQYPSVIHRDIKPQNLKLTPRGELFLIDFGLAKDATTPTRPGHSIHAYTLEFAPPEQIKGEGTDARSDLYSLGATLYHLATGKLPPDARIREEMMVKHLMPDPLQPAHYVNPQVPFAFAAALSKALALDREQRYQNAQEMWRALRRIKQDIEAEVAERERQEAERWRLEEEERKRREEEARQREIEERRRREEVARRQLGDKFTETVRGLNLELVRVPGGSFLMGSPDNEPERISYEGPQHRVTVPSFYIGKYEVTQAQWRKVAGLPKVDADLQSDPAYFKGDNLPVERVSYWEAREFCARLSRETGRSYRLPSEAEWEYAARAGTTTPFAFGSSLSSEQANFDGNYPYGGAPKGVYRAKTTPVGSFAPNAFKLHDMHGNVWEWCEDFWHNDYNGAPTDGSAWLSGGDSSLRVLRGGSWLYNGRNCRAANRLRIGAGARPPPTMSVFVLQFRRGLCSPLALLPFCPMPAQRA